MISVQTVSVDFPVSNNGVNNTKTKSQVKNKKRTKNKKKIPTTTPIDNINETENIDQQLQKSENCDKKNNVTRRKKVSTVKKKTTQQKQSNLITNYFPVVSRRLLDAKLKEEEYNKKIIHCIKNKTDPKDYLSVTEFEDKGKAIIATSLIRKGSFICEYSGDLIDLSKAKMREKQYEVTNPGCYMYYFNWNSTTWCVDATEPTGRYGRLINHSRKAPNCKTKVFEYENEPHLIFIALRDINPQEEILYDYGERDSNAIKSNPWLTRT